MLYYLSRTDRPVDKPKRIARFPCMGDETGLTMAKKRIESILVSTAYEIAVAALAPEARPGDEYFEKLIKDSKEPEITIDFEEIDRLKSRFIDCL